MSGIFGVKKISISIHALHEESDLTVDGDTARSNEFQSTLSMRRATTLMAEIVGEGRHFNPRSP